MCLLCMLICHFFQQTKLIFEVGIIAHVICLIGFGLTSTKAKINERIG